MKAPVGVWVGAGAEAVLGGALVGALEAARVVVAAGEGSLLDGCVIGAFATAGAIAAAVAVQIAFALLGRLRRVAHWTGDILADGAPRAIAVWRAALIVSAAIAFGWVCFHSGAWVHEAHRFNDGATVGLALAGIDTPIGGALIVAASALDHRVSTWLAGKPWAHLDGRRARIACAIACAIVALAPLPIIHRAVPAVRLGGVMIGSFTVAAIGLARVLRIAARRGARRIALAVALAAAAGMAASVVAPRARRLVIEQGFASTGAARLLWSLADRDGDGYPAAALGGADCDDGDPERNPSATDVAGNGRDENCTGADADPAAVSARAAPGPASSAAVDAHDAGHAPVGPRSILLISVDALRPDHLGAWGYARPTSPAIDRFAATATRFTWALTSSPSTRHAIPSLHTGRYASNIPLDPPPATLAEALRDAGWDTAVIMAGRTIVAPRVLRGFANIDLTADAELLARDGKANGDVVADLATRWLATHAASGPPFLLWLHFYDPHHPYTTPDGIAPFGDSDLDRYDAEIAFVDRAIGRVLEALHRAGLASSTVVALASDHGDEFNEHGLRFHARSLYNQVVRIPLIVRVPGAPPATIDTPVSIVDIMPTLLDLVGQPEPAGMNGRSLAGALRGTGTPPARPVLLELAPDRTIHRNLAAAVTGDAKVIWDREANAWSLYARADVADTTDRSAADPATLAAMQRELLLLLDTELGTYSAGGMPSR